MGRFVNIFVSTIYAMDLVMYRGNRLGSSTSMPVSNWNHSVHFLHVGKIVLPLVPAAFSQRMDSKYLKICPNDNGNNPYGLRGGRRLLDYGPG